MKNLITTIALIIILSGVAWAQKYAYVDSEYILANIPEYKEAQKQIDELAEEFQKEIEVKFAEIDAMYKAYQAEAVLMPEDIKKKKEDEITAKRNEVKELQNQKFGKEGELFVKREELIRPIQEKIYNAIEDIAVEKNYAFVFDKAGSLTMLYVNPKFDLSDDVLDNVGAALGTIRREDRKKTDYQPSTESKGNTDNKSIEPKNNSNMMSPPSRNGGPGTGPVNKDGKK
jgi:outer membrane protein